MRWFRLCFVLSCALRRDLRSFPTRRSSDLLFLPLAIASWWGRPPADATAALWLLGLFAVSIGLPFFADRKSTRLNSSHVSISYAVFCLKKKIISLRASPADRRRSRSRPCGV